MKKREEGIRLESGKKMSDCKVGWGGGDGETKQF